MTQTATASLIDVQQFFESHKDCTEFVVFDGTEDQVVYNPEQALQIMTAWSQDDPESRIKLEAWIDPEVLGNHYTLNFNYF